MKIRRWLGAIFGPAAPDGLGSIRFRGAMIGVVASVVLPSALVASGLSRAQLAAIPPAYAWRLSVQQIGWPITDFVAMQQALIAAIELPGLVSLAVLPLLCVAILMYFALWPAAGAATAHLMALAVRTRRVRRGRCAACTYPLVERPRCAECGLLRCEPATPPTRWRIRLACLPLAVIAAVNLLPLALHLTVPHATVLVSSVYHVRDGAAEGPDAFRFDTPIFGWLGLSSSVCRHPSLCRVTWVVPPEGPVASEVVVRFGWPVPWCMAGSERLPRQLLYLSPADPGWMRLREELDVPPVADPSRPAGEADAAVAGTTPSEPYNTRIFRRKVAAALLEQGQYQLRTHWPALAGNFLFGAMFSAIALAAMMRAPVPRVASASQPLSE